MTTWLTTWPRPEDPERARTPVRGREAELAFVEARLDALARGEGGIVRVEGPAGSGRSRLLLEASASAERRGTRVLHGRADPDAQFVPLGPLLEGLLSGGEPLPDAARIRDLAATPGQRFWLLQELADRLREAARDRPLLILLDDLQWCDDLTLLAFHTVAAALASHRVLWLVTVRGGAVPPGVRTTLDRIRQAGAHELTLGPLGDRAMARITEDVLGAVPGPDVLRVADRAEGVPLLLVELLDALREEDLVTIENGTAGLTPGAFPSRRLPSVGRRLDQLSEAARELVETAAAVGRPVTVGLLAELLDRPPAALITAVREALESDLLAERADRLAFRHEVVREAVEAGLSPSLLRTLRRHAAEVRPEGPRAEPSAPPADGTGPGEGTEPGGTGPSEGTEPGGKTGPRDRTGPGRPRTAAAELPTTAPGAAAPPRPRTPEPTAADAPEPTADDVPEGAEEAAGTVPPLGRPGQDAVTRTWLMNRTRALLEAGRPADARAAAEAASEPVDGLGRGDFADITFHHTMMRVAIHTDDGRAVRRYASEARRARSAGTPRVRTVGAWMLALAADFDGLPERAVAALDEVMAAQAGEPAFPVGPVDPADLPVLVRMALRAGIHDRAAPAVRAAERRAELDPGSTLLAATAAHARGLLDNSLGHLRRAVLLHEDGPRPLARASALEDTGRKLAATRKSEAVPYLEKALALYTRAGAERDVARVHRRLRAAGLRRRPSPAGQDARWPELTAAEVRVARLVARGLTNPQVAEHLSLSPHTVGSHLRRAFTKLDITSRGELTRLVETRDSGE
ncbi:AAA family ATPase [Streptomyces sp. NPDC058664]|uniref:AAA family ATPase n=1 Tax=unclassified Streptomyces TaxID=2593676 RepID=UPI003666CD73